MIAILSVVHHIACFNHPLHCVLLYLDSLNSIAVFNLFGAAKSLHNCVLKAIAGIILEAGIDLRVSHIANKYNVCDDLLLCLLLANYWHQFPADHIYTFEPSHHLLLARVLLKSLGRLSLLICLSMALEDLDSWILHLQANVIEKMTTAVYTTRA